MAVVVRYASGAMLTYSLSAYNPWEGYRIMFTGSRGRLEVQMTERAYVPVAGRAVDPSYSGVESEDGERSARLRPSQILLQHHWEPVHEIALEEEEASGHGGGDTRLLNHIFRGVEDDPLRQAAGCLDGARSLLIGVAANRSIASGMPVRSQDLVTL